MEEKSTVKGESEYSPFDAPVKEPKTNAQQSAVVSEYSPFDSPVRAPKSTEN